MRVNTDNIASNGNTMPMVDIIQWVHQHNKFQKVWGISFRPDKFGRVQSYLETNCAHIMNAVQTQWPNARIENIPEAAE